MKLIKITDSIFYIRNPSNIGVIKLDHEAVILIDSGIDGEAGKKILKILAENGLHPVAIVNTHAHADHCGGNSYIKEATGARIYAPQVESAIIEFPCLEPLYLFSGASPVADLQNKFLMAKPSTVDIVIKRSEAEICIDNTELKIIPLPGHTSDQIGIESNGVLFCADSLFPEKIIVKHKIPFFTDIDKAKESLLALQSSHYQFYVPAHAEHQTDLRETISLNIETINKVEEDIFHALNERKTTENVLRAICTRYDMEIKGVQQYYLMNTVVMAFLSSLYKRNKIGIEIDKNSLYWRVKAE